MTLMAGDGYIEDGISEANANEKILRRIFKKSMPPGIGGPFFDNLVRSFHAEETEAPALAHREVSNVSQNVVSSTNELG